MRKFICRVPDQTNVSVTVGAAILCDLDKAIQHLTNLSGKAGVVLYQVTGLSWKIYVKCISLKTLKNRENTNKQTNKNNSSWNEIVEHSLFWLAFCPLLWVELSKPFLYYKMNYVINTISAMLGINLKVLTRDKCSQIHSFIKFHYAFSILLTAGKQNSPKFLWNPRSWQIAKRKILNLWL